jgi:hypothetical protein
MSDIDFNIDEFTQNEDPNQLVRDKVAGEMPTMEDPEDARIVLPRGIYAEGKWNTESNVRELTGADEEYLSRKRDPLDYFDAVIGLGVERVGDLDLLSKPLSEREEILSKLLTGERELLFLSVIRATFGNERELQYVCGSCSNDFTTTLLLDTDFVLTDTLGIDPPLTYEFTTSKGDTIEYRLVNGADQRAATKKKNATVAEQNTSILTSTIKRVNGDVPFDMRDFVLGLTMKDRRDLVSDMDDRQPVVDNELELVCPSCDATNTVLINWGDLFRP